MRRRTFGALADSLALLCLAFCICSAAAAEQSIEVTFTDTVDRGPLTGRLIVAVAKDNTVEPRLRATSFGGSTPFFGIDVVGWQPGETAKLGGDILGYPIDRLKDLPAGDYYVQAVLNVYTQVKRQDGHTIWVHLDQWEGQSWKRSPGNLISRVERLHLDPAAGFKVKLSLESKLPPVQVPPDTEWVKRVKIQSKLLSEFWGCPIYLGATVLLPRGYEQNPEMRYAAIYVQGHFSLGAPFGFSSRPAAKTRGAGASFYEAWTGDDFPRMIAVTFQHPTPYYDDSYAVNSANNGPYGDALTQELIPYLEEHFRILARPEARVLTGGSTGGWEALALQIYHPQFFNGTWAFYPDPVDFRRYQLIDIYRDENAFEVPSGAWAKWERPIARTVDGQVTQTVRQMSRGEAVLGSRVRSGGQIAAWDAAYGPVGADGYPRPLWDRLTGKIDKEVAAYMRDNGYDLRHYLAQNWPTIGKDLTGKIYVSCGDADTYFLDVAVDDLASFLKATKDPPANSIFEYGRKKSHGWQPMSNADLVRKMAERINATAPDLVPQR